MSIHDRPPDFSREHTPPGTSTTPQETTWQGRKVTQLKSSKLFFALKIIGSFVSLPLRFLFRHIFSYEGKKPESVTNPYLKEMQQAIDAHLIHFPEDAKIASEGKTYFTTPSTLASFLDALAKIPDDDKQAIFQVFKDAHASGMANQALHQGEAFAQHVFHINAESFTQRTALLHTPEGHLELFQMAKKIRSADRRLINELKTEQPGIISGEYLLINLSKQLRGRQYDKIISDARKDFNIQKKSSYLVIERTQSIISQLTTFIAQRGMPPSKIIFAGEQGEDVRGLSKECAQLASTQFYGAFKEQLQQNDQGEFDLRSDAHPKNITEMGHVLRYLLSNHVRLTEPVHFSEDFYKSLALFESDDLETLDSLALMLGGKNEAELFHFYAKLLPSEVRSPNGDQMTLNAYKEMLGEKGNISEEIKTRILKRENHFQLARVLTQEGLMPLEFDLEARLTPQRAKDRLADLNAWQFPTIDLTVKNLLEKHFMTWVKSAKEETLRDFLQAVTGRQSLPENEQIRFEFDPDASDNPLPMTHTCFNTLVLPAMTDTQLTYTLPGGKNNTLVMTDTKSFIKWLEASIPFIKEGYGSD